MVLTPQMAISHLVMTIGVGISQKKISKILTMYKYCGMTHIYYIWSIYSVEIRHRKNGSTPVNAFLTYIKIKLIYLVVVKRQCLFGMH